MNGSTTIPAWDVHAVYHTAEGIDPSSTTCLICCSVSSVCLRCATLRLVRGWRRHEALYFSMWWGGRANYTLRLNRISPVGLALACAWWRIRIYSLVVVVFVLYYYKLRQASDWFWCCCTEPSCHCLRTTEGRWTSFILSIGILRSLVCMILSVSMWE